MIRFRFFACEPNYSEKNIIIKVQCGYPEILRILGEFQILFNDSVVFFEPDFPILEFLRDVLAWINSNNKEKSMEYISIETDDNPLISFTKRGELWSVDSKWKKTDCDILVSREEIEKAILDLVTSLT